MASTAPKLEKPDLLRDYLRNLSREGGSHDVVIDEGRQVRTCARCGERTVFRVEPEGTWYRCGACREYA